MNPEFNDQLQHRPTPAVDTDAPRRRFTGLGARPPCTPGVTGPFGSHSHPRETP
jgi:hypothetical protein